jgi:HAE1 family hydrophobic/amphiphilic exporter-1
MTRFFLRHPVTTWMLFASFVVLGIYAVPRLQVEAIPEVRLPSLVISSNWNGASPQAVQRSLTLPIEEAVRSVHGVESVRSTSRAARSEVEVEFRREVDIDFARLELNEHLGSVRRNLPLGATQPQVVAHVPEEFQTENFFTFSLESTLDPNELADQAETWIVPRLLGVDGVGDARVQGGARPLLKILLDRQKLDLYGLRADEVFVAIDRLDDLSAAGTIREQGLEKIVSVREPVDLQALRAAPVAQRGGRTFRLEMVGEVRQTHEDPVYFVRANGHNVVQVVVDKRSNANSVEVSRSLRDALPRLEREVPFAATFHVDTDQGHDLERKLYELLMRSGVIVLVLFVLMALSLRQVRLTAIITGSIFFAVVISLSLFYFMRISVNFITISGLTIAFGELLDNSILVLDGIHRRLRALEQAEKENLSHRAKLSIMVQTIVEGTREVQFPIYATTLSTLAAFASFIFLSGRLALYYTPLAIAIATSMMGSLFVAFCWTPVVLHGAWAKPLVRRSHDGTNDVADARILHAYVEDRHDLDEPQGILERCFDWSQRLWWLIVPATLAVLVWGTYFVYRDKVLKGGFWRFPDQKELFLYLEMPAGTDIRLATETLRLYEDSIAPVEKGVRMSSTTFDYRGFIRVEFDKKLLTTEIPAYYRDVWVDLADRTGGVSIFIRGFADQPYFKGPFAGSSLNSLVKITGYNSKQLNRIAEATLHKLQKQRRVRNARVTSGLQWGDRSTQDETVITLQRERLAEYGLTVADVLGQVRRLLGVDFPWTMQIDGEQEQVQLAFDDSETIQYAEVAAKTIVTREGQRVRLGDLVRLEERPIPASVIRENQRYSVFVNWEYVGTDKMRQSYIKRILDSMDLPYGYSAEEARDEFITPEENDQLNLAAGLAMGFIGLLMAALFESITLPLLVLLSLPMSLVGVFVAFWITGDAFDSSARIGLVLLFAVAVKNAILQASRFREESSLVLKAKLGGDPEAQAALFAGLRHPLGGVDLYQLDAKERPALLRRAVARATRIRLSSILLTSATTVIGLAPLLIPMPDLLANLLGGKPTEGKDIWENLALTSIGGTLSSTVLLVIGLPATYYASVRAAWLARRLWEGQRARAARRVARRTAAASIS